MIGVGRSWGTAAAALVACVAIPGVAGCGSDEDEPPGSTPGAVEPIAELAGPTGAGRRLGSGRRDQDRGRRRGGAGRGGEERGRLRGWGGTGDRVRVRARR